MTLAFSEQINKQPSCFPEKIWQGLLDHNLAEAFDFMDYDQSYKALFDKAWDTPLHDPIIPKLHTIREDPANRWRAGMDIHMVINNRTKNRFQFAPVVKCVSVQEINITDESDKAFPTDYLTEISVVIKRADWQETFYLAYSVKVDGKALSAKEVSELAINDGFDSVEDFFAYFDKDFKGKIIHWTDLKY